MNKTLSTLIIGACFALALFSPALAQQSGGLRIMDTDPEGVCKDESAGVSNQNIRRQAELARELTTMLKRTAEIQDRLAAGEGKAEGKELKAELSRMIERAGRMTAELEGMAKTP